MPYPRRVVYALHAVGEENLKLIEVRLRCRRRQRDDEGCKTSWDEGLTAHGMTLQKPWLQRQANCLQRTKEAHQRSPAGFRFYGAEIVNAQGSAGVEDRK